MVASLTEGKKKYQPVEGQIRDIHLQLSEARSVLHRLVEEDADAYRGVTAALKLPKESAEEKAARTEALARTTRIATEVPLRTARLAAQALGQLAILAEIGNRNAQSDAATGAQLAFAALKGAQYNVLINLPSLADRAFAEACREEADELARRGQEALQKVDALLTLPR